MSEDKEREIVKKALENKQSKGCTLKIPFIGIDHLVEDIKMMFPATNVLCVYDSDQRDSDGGPTLTRRTLRSLRATLTHRRTQYSDEVVGFDAKWRMVFVAIEKSMAFIKVANLNVGDVER